MIKWLAKYLHSTNEINIQSESAGFTVVELMVSIAIMAMLGGVIVVSQQDFNKSVRLKNAAHELAILFREQQSQATDVLVTTADSDYDRGIYLDLTNKHDAKFVQFVDSIEDGYYTDSSEQDGIFPIKLNSPLVVKQVCFFGEGSNPTFCSDDYHGATPPIYIGDSDFCIEPDTPSFNPSIIYSRPLLQPRISAAKNCGYSNDPEYINNFNSSTDDLILINNREDIFEVERVEIIIDTADRPSGNHQFVVIDASGGIYVK